MTTNIINKLRKKNKKKTLKLLFSAFALFKIELTTKDVSEAINSLGVKRFRQLFGYLDINKEHGIQLEAFDPSSQLTVKSKLKVAVCLSGDIRSFKHCNEQLQRFFSGYEITLFCHGWKSDIEKAQLSRLNNAYTCIESRPDLTDLERTSLKSFGFKIFGNGLKVPFMSPNIFPMWFGIKRAYESIEEHGFQRNEFDLICRCRYDNFFLGRLAQLQEIPSTDELIIDPNYDGYGGYGDQFAIGSPTAMKKYSTLFDWLPKSFIQYEGDKRFFPEVIVKKYLVDECNLKVRQIDFGLRILRNEFIGLEGHKIPLRSHAVSQSRNHQVSNYIKNKFPDIYNSMD
jgi:hypothetical protein